MHSFFLRRFAGVGLLGVLVWFGLPAAGLASPADLLPDTTAADTTDIRVVQPGAPGEPTRVLVSGTSAETPRLVQPGAPGEPSRVLHRGGGQVVRIVRPGAPGEPSRVLQVRRGHQRSEPTYTAADVQFMQNMILHHAQALQMTALVEERTESEAIHQLATRIERSQHDEIATMMQWLEERGEPLPELPPDVAAQLEGDEDPPVPDYHAHDHSEMHGILSPDQMEELAVASGETFERLFLEFMIVHHEGAITMVDELFAAPEGGQETDIFTFASHVEADQQIEIERMNRMLQANY